MVRTTQGATPSSTPTKALSGLPDSDEESDSSFGEDPDWIVSPLQSKKKKKESSLEVLESILREKQDEEKRLKEMAAKYENESNQTAAKILETTRNLNRLQTATNIETQDKIKQDTLPLGLLACFACCDESHSSFPLEELQKNLEVEVCKQEHQLWNAFRKRMSDDALARRLLVERIAPRVACTHNIKCPVDILLWLVKTLISSSSPTISQLALVNLACILANDSEMAILTNHGGLSEAVSKSVESTSKHAKPQGSNVHMDCSFFVSLLKFCGVNLSKLRVPELETENLTWSRKGVGSTRGELGSALELLQVALQTGSLQMKCATENIIELLTHLLVLKVDPIAMEHQLFHDNSTTELLIENVPSEVWASVLHMVCDNVYQFNDLADRKTLKPDSSQTEVAVDTHNTMLKIAASLPQNQPRCGDMMVALVSKVWQRGDLQKAVPRNFQLAVQNNKAWVKALETLNSGRDDDAILQVVAALANDFRRSFIEKQEDAQLMRIQSVVLQTMSILLLNVSDKTHETHRKLREEIYWNLSESINGFRHKTRYVTLVEFNFQLISHLLQKYSRFNGRSIAIQQSSLKTFVGSTF